jgi:cytochrome c oxidase assembly factor CtaG
MPYHGPPELTLTRALTEWTFDPWALILILVLGGGYLACMRRVRRTGQDWSVARPIWFLGLGLGPLVLATMSWVGVYQSVLFYARATQTVLLVLVVPLFLAMGRPIGLVIAALPRLGARLDAAIKSPVAKVLTFPAFTTFALVLVPFVMYFTPWYTASFHSTLVRVLTYLALMTAGFMFYWTLLRVDPVPKQYSYAVSMWITAAQVVGDAVLGIACIADNGIIGAVWYHAVARPWGPTLQVDQVIGGGVLWVLGDLVGLPFLAAQFIHLMREDETEAVRIDAELDAQESARAEGLAAAAVSAGLAERGPGTAGSADHAESLADRPWWEADSRFSDRFKSADSPSSAQDRN